jgi:hypothetical protein
VHTTAAHAPLTQTWLLAAQSLTVVAVRPSAEQLVTFSSVAEQPVVDGVQTHGVQVATPVPLIVQVRLEEQLDTLPHVLPSEEQVEIPLPWHRVDPATHTSRRHSPLLQYRLEGQSAVELQLTQ